LTSAGFAAAAALVDKKSYSGLTGQLSQECPSTPAPTVQPTGVSEAAKLNGVTMILVYARHPELRGTLQQRRGQPV